MQLAYGKCKNGNMNDTKEMAGQLLTNSSSGLAGGLVKPCPHIVLPMLFKVPIRYDIVVLHGLPICTKPPRNIFRIM